VTLQFLVDLIQNDPLATIYDNNHFIQNVRQAIIACYTVSLFKPIKIFTAMLQGIINKTQSITTLLLSTGTDTHQYHTVWSHNEPIFLVVTHF